MSDFYTSPCLECSLPLREEILFQPSGKKGHVFPDMKIDSVTLGTRVEIDFACELSLTYTAVALVSDEDLEGWETDRLKALQGTDARFLLSLRSDFSTCNAAKWDAFRTLFHWLDENCHEDLNDPLEQNLVGDLWFAGRVMSLEAFRQFLTQEWSLPALIYLQERDGEFCLDEIQEEGLTVPFAVLQSCAHGESAGFLLWWDSQSEGGKLQPAEPIVKCANRLLDDTSETLIAEISNGDQTCFVQRLPEIAEDLSVAWETRFLASVPSFRCALQFDLVENFWDVRNQENLIWDSMAGFSPWISPQLRERDFLVYGLSFYQEETGESWSDGQDLDRNSDYELLFQRVEGLLKDQGQVLSAPLTSVDLGFAKAFDECENEYDISNVEIRRLLEEKIWQKMKSFIAVDTDEGIDDLGYFVAQHPTPHGLFAASGYLRVGYEQLHKLLRHPDLHFMAFVDIPPEVRNADLQTLLRDEIEDHSPSLFSRLVKGFGAQFCAGLHDGWADGLTFANDEDFKRYLQYRLLNVAAEVVEQKDLTAPDSETLQTLAQTLKTCNTGDDRCLVFEPEPLSGVEGWQIACLGDSCAAVQLVADGPDRYHWKVVSL